MASNPEAPGSLDDEVNAVDVGALIVQSYHDRNTQYIGVRLNFKEEIAVVRSLHQLYCGKVRIRGWFFDEKGGVFQVTYPDQRLFYRGNKYTSNGQ